jgi:hypothetical protein
MVAKEVPTIFALCYLAAVIAGGHIYTLLFENVLRVRFRNIKIAIWWYCSYI